LSARLREGPEIEKGAEAPFLYTPWNLLISMEKNPGAGDESRTRDLNLGKVALYQLSYSRRGVSLLALRLPHCLSTSFFASEAEVYLIF
jgi:hypothetical protein